MGLDSNYCVLQCIYNSALLQCATVHPGVITCAVLQYTLCYPAPLDSIRRCIPDPTPETRPDISDPTHSLKSPG